MTDVAMIGLGLNTDPLRRGEQALDSLGRRGDRTQGTIKRATDRMVSGFRNVASRVFNLRTAIATLAGSAGIGLLVRSNMEAIDELAKFSDTVGDTTENIQAMRRQAELAGVDVRTFDSALQRFSRRAAQAADDTGAASDAYKRLGLSARELSQAQPTEAFWEVAEAIRGVSNRSEQLRMANELLGREAEDMIRVIDQGEESFNAIRREMEATGEAISRIDAARIEQANDAITKMRGNMRVFGQTLTIELADNISTVASHMSRSFASAGTTMQEQIGNAVDASVSAFATLLDRSADVVDFISDNAVSAQFGLLGWLFFGPKGAAIGAAIGAAFDQIEEGLARFGIGIDDAEDKARRLVSVQEEMAQKQEELRRIQERMDASDYDVVDQNLALIVLELREEIGELEEAETRLQIAVDGSSDAQDRYRGIMEGSASATDRATSGARELASVLRLSLGPEIRTIGEELDALESGVTPRIRTPEIGGVVPDLDIKTLEDYAQEWDNIAEKIGEAGDETDRVDRAQRRLQMTFQSAFKDAIIAGEGLRDVLAGVAQDIARIMLRQAVTEPAGQAMASAFAGAFNFGGARADGGDVQQGVSYLVGERGPEIFTPGQTGAITPNENISNSSNTTVNNNINISADGADPEQLARLTESVRALDRNFERRAVGSMQDARSRGRIR